MGGNLSLSRRLLWTVEDESAPDRPHRPSGISLGIRLKYGLVAAIGVFFVTRSALAVWEFKSIHHLICGSLLIILATLAAAGLCRFPLFRHACTGIGLWLTISPCTLPQAFCGLDACLGLAAFLSAGCAADAWREEDVQGLSPAD